MKRILKEPEFLGRTAMFVQWYSHLVLPGIVCDAASGIMSESVKKKHLHMRMRRCSHWKELQNDNPKVLKRSILTLGNFILNFFQVLFVMAQCAIMEGRIMYRVMIIDDEMSARRLLQASIDWKSLDMELVGEAASGIEAINIIDELRPDIVFVDISMPFMNGIEFTQVATKRYTDLVIIILTGLDDFEFARQCVRLPVVEYMLKPFVRQEVTELLIKTKENLDKHKTRTQEIERDITPSDIEHIMQYIRDNFIDSNINLTSVAQHFGFNPSYLSRKFKQETGKSFVEFLIKCRMERATLLAGTSQKMFCTANDVGIPDPNYFGRCFKKYTGISYSEYVNTHTAQ